MTRRRAECFLGLSSHREFGGGGDFLPRPASVEAREAALAATGDDEERRGVVELVQQPAVGGGEPEPQVEASVGEREALDVEADPDVPRPLGPAEGGRLLAAAGDEQARLAAQLVPEPRGSKRALGDEADAQRERFAGEELEPGLVVRP